MKIVFPLYHKNTMTYKKTGVWGEELIANSCCDLLNANGHQAETVVCKEFAEETEYDLAIYMTHKLFHPKLNKKLAKKNILWIQGFTYAEDNKTIIPLDNIYNFAKTELDLIITSSVKLSEIFNIPFLIPRIDLKLYSKPELVVLDKEYDISYIGNYTKPITRNLQYLSPISSFNYLLKGGDFGKLDHNEWVNAVNTSKVNLHFGFQEDTDWNMVSGAALFLAATGGFCLMDKIPWYTETFKDAFGFTEGGEDEIEKIKYYLENDALRLKMTDKAYEIVNNLKYDTLLGIVNGI